jgi:hypothetical protein
MHALTVGMGLKFQRINCKQSEENVKNYLHHLWLIKSEHIYKMIFNHIKFYMPHLLGNGVKVGALISKLWKFL